ncbi:DUF1194 domain-containing protein [Falsiroseomonas sp.]|uniref:DUF1194 domain-containing protein n=1 Tax=Falsiroseomonas sp. TaxID=2870721 RepID=UPI0035679D78
MRRRSIIAAAASAVAMAGLLRPARAAEDPVDVLLVLATDVSRSVDEDEARLQRDGYYASLTHPRVMEVIRNGPLGAVGVAYVEWSGESYQSQPVPWTRISSLAEAEAWVGAMERHPPRAHGWTSISGAIDFSRGVLAQAPWTGTRRVLDISGDGMNNSGRDPMAARDAALNEGITINGLPILKDRPIPGAAALDEYYRENVIGGPGAFVIPAGDFRSFARALRRKLIMEIAGITPEPASRA